MKELWMDRFFSRYPPHFRHTVRRMAGYSLLATVRVEKGSKRLKSAQEG